MVAMPVLILCSCVLATQDELERDGGREGGREGGRVGKEEDRGKGREREEVGKR